MKKLLFVLAFAFVFAGGVSVSHASAAVVCDYPDHAIWDNANAEKTGCITASAWDASVASQVRNVGDTIQVARGQRLMTTYGFEDGCPDWFPPSGCVIKKAIFVKFL